MTRIVELAREQAFIKHAHYALMKNTQGHVQAMGDKEWGFTACPHPDCVLVCADAAASRAPSPQDAEKTVMTIEVFHGEGKFSCLAQKNSGKVGIGTGDSSTLVGALAELCETLIKVAEDESTEPAAVVPDPLTALVQQLYRDMTDTPAIGLGDGKFYRTVPDERLADLEVALRRAAELEETP